MKRIKKVGIITALFTVAVLAIVNTPIYGILQASPLWVHFVLLGIVLSGYLSFKFTREEKLVEQEIIEKEGEVFLEKVRARRNAARELS